MKKYVFIIDLDATIIGNCKYQLELYKQYMLLKSKGIKININKLFHNFYVEKAKLCRPYFSYFITKMRELYKNNVYFYVYTASSHEWANFEIKIIEKANNIKFNRPIFTKNDCKLDSKEQCYVKIVTPILDKIKPKDPEIIIIDDCEVYKDFKESHILCRPYKYTVFCELHNYLLPEQKNIKNLLICPFTNKTKQYKWLYKKSKDIDNKNKDFLEDKFWLYLANTIIKHKISNYNPNIIKQLTTIANSY